jgi:hypothetical protein
VVTEEDMLEFEHLWHDSEKRPQRLINYLKDKYILMLGCNFQNWLTRFFLFALKPESLLDTKLGSSGVIADTKTKEDEELVLFLARCQTHLYAGGVDEFIRELSKRWHEQNDKNGSSVIDNQVNTDFKSASVFLSYASEDRAIVESIAAQLEGRGVDVWFDRGELKSGDDFKEKIINNIEESSLFVPIISKNVCTSQRRFFRLEWRAAIDDSKMRPPGQPFILPLVIDSTNETEEFIPKEFKQIQWEGTLDNKVSDEFISMLIQNIREQRRREQVKL